MAKLALSNYLVSTNPFGLVKPPAWFLREMSKFDVDLVIFPSMKNPVFRLSRRAKRSGGVKPADVPSVQNHPDTLFMWNNKLVPVTTIIPKDHWGTHIFEKLAARDIWRHGGAKKVVETIEEHERQMKALVQKDFESKGEQVHSDAYASYKYRTGQRVSMAHKGSAVNRRNKTAPLIFGPSGKPASSYPQPDAARVQLVAA